MCRSSILSHSDSNEIGRYFAWSEVLALHLETGTTVDVFQAVGTVPVATDRLNSLVNTGFTLEAVILSIFPVIPSGPHALVKYFSDFQKSLLL